MSYSLPLNSLKFQSKKRNPLWKEHMTVFIERKYERFSSIVSRDFLYLDIYHKLIIK